MHPSASDALIRWFADYCTGPSPSPSTGSNPNTGALGCIVYEMFGLTDAFGRVMLNNLRVSAYTPVSHAYPCLTRIPLSHPPPPRLFIPPSASPQSRGVALPRADPYPTRASLPPRFLRLGFSAAHALTLREIRADYTPRPELERCAPSPIFHYIYIYIYSSIFIYFLIFAPPDTNAKSLSTLELLDEIEELDLVLAHYAITWSIKLPGAGPDPDTDSNADPIAEADPDTAARPQPAAWLAWGLDAHPARPARAEDE